MITIVTGFVVMGELVLAGVIYVSVAAPDRVPEPVRRTPLYWRLFALLGWSFVVGAMLQLAGATYPLR